MSKLWGDQMKRTLTFCAFALLAGTSLAEAGGAGSGTCTATGYMQDNIDLTAALINPGNLTGDVNATGCNIGVYYSGGTHNVNRANIHGSNYYGILNNGATVNVENSSISEIGDKPFDGDQHGVGIYWVGGSGREATSLATSSGTIRRTVSPFTGRTPPPVS
jgi:hypothetical protein